MTMDYNNPDQHWWPGQRNPLDDMNEHDHIINNIY